MVHFSPKNAKSRFGPLWNGYRTILVPIHHASFFGATKLLYQFAPAWLSQWDLPYIISEYCLNWSPWTTVKMSRMVYILVYIPDTSMDVWLCCNKSKKKITIISSTAGFCYFQVKIKKTIFEYRNLTVNAFKIRWRWVWAEKDLVTMFCFFVFFSRYR